MRRMIERRFANSWTYNFLKEVSCSMSVGSAWKYRRMVLDEHRRSPSSGPDGCATLRMKRPIQGEIRIRPASSDYHTLREVAFKQVYRQACERAGDCRTVIDLGANIGLATRYFAARYPECRIFAVEPNRENYRLLEWNVAKIAPSGRCRVVRQAVWSRPGAIAVSAPPGGNSFDSVVVGGEGGELVQGATPQQILEASGFDRVDLMKIDVEGAEVEIFKGDLGWLGRVRTMAIEFHGDSRRESSFDEIAGSHGFRVEGDDHTIIAHRD
jgi:FkbM family methyltransferase